MSLPWLTGQRCLVAECDQGTGGRSVTGLVLAAVVTYFSLNGDINVAPETARLRDGTWVATRFDPGDGWNTYGWERCWRLMLPEDFTAEPGAWRPGDPVPDAPGHGYHEAGDY
jgi:hypothetical protein